MRNSNDSISHLLVKSVPLVSAFLGVLLLVGCEKKQPNVELLQDMMESPSVKAQDYNPDNVGEQAMLVPPEHTVARGNAPYNCKMDSFTAENVVKNPTVKSEELLARGQTAYQTFCAVCHGALGDGESTMKTYFPGGVPSVISEKIRGWKDGGIYHLMRCGRGLMGSYESQVTNEEDRWAIVQYIREMQSKQAVK